MPPSPAALNPFGAPAWIASALVHGALVLGVATAVHVRATPPPLSGPTVTVEVQVDTVSAVPPVPAPPPDRIEPARVVAHAATHTTSAVATPPSPPSIASPVPSTNAPQVVAAPGAPATFVISMSSGSFSGTVTASPAITAPSSQAVGADDEIVDEKGVSSPATVATQPVPTYPVEARAAEIESDVPVDIVVDKTGHVIEARVAHRVGWGLDEAALDTVRRTHFHPAQRNGRTVAVRMRWTMQFRLQ
jgi:TonB family protein